MFVHGTWCDMASSVQDGGTALIVASTFGHVECVKVLLSRGAQANLQDKVSTDVCCKHVSLCDEETVRVECMQLGVGHVGEVEPVCELVWVWGVWCLRVVIWCAMVWGPCK